MCQSCQVSLARNPQTGVASRVDLVLYLVTYGVTFGKLALIDLVTSEFCIAAQYSAPQLMTVEIVDIAYHTAAHVYDLDQPSLGYSVNQAVSR